MRLARACARAHTQTLSATSLRTHTHTHFLRMKKNKGKYLQLSREQQGIGFLVWVEEYWGVRRGNDIYELDNCQCGAVNQDDLTMMLSEG